MQAMESAFDVCTEDLFNQTVKLEEMRRRRVMPRGMSAPSGPALSCFRRTMRNKKTA